MKKRLLSAALALAMVLTLLPVSAFAAPAAPVVPPAPPSPTATSQAPAAGTIVTYCATDEPSTGKTAGNWYWSDTSTNPATLYVVPSGTGGYVDSAGRYYTDAIGGNNGGIKSGSVKLVGATSIWFANLTGTVTVDTMGNNTLTIQNGKGSAQFTGLSVTSSVRDNLGNIVKGTVSGAINDISFYSNFALSLQNVTGSDAIAINSTGASSAKVELDNATGFGAISIAVSEDTANRTCSGGSVSLINASSSGAITINHAATQPTVATSGGSVTVNNSTVGGAIRINQAGGTTKDGSISVTNGSSVSGETAIFHAATTTAEGGSITVDNSSITSGGVQINYNAGTKSTGGSITMDHGVRVTGNVEINHNPAPTSASPKDSEGGTVTLGSTAANGTVSVNGRIHVLSRHGGRLTTTNTTSTAVEMWGYGTTLTATSSRLGAVTMLAVTTQQETAYPGSKDLDQAPVLTFTGTNQNNAAAFSNINKHTNEILVAPYKINVTANAFGTEITGVPEAIITVDQGHPGAVTINGGSLNIAGTSSTVGNITLGANSAGRAVALNVTGSGVTTGDITVVASNQRVVTIATPADDTNHFGKVVDNGLSDAYLINGQIKGGNFAANNGKGVPDHWLDLNSLHFLLRETVVGYGLEFCYYPLGQLDKVISRYQNTTDKEQNAGGILVGFVGQGDLTRSNAIVLRQSDYALGSSTNDGITTTAPAPNAIPSLPLATNIVTNGGDAAKLDGLLVVIHFNQGYSSYFNLPNLSSGGEAASWTVEQNGTAPLDQNVYGAGKFSLSGAATGYYVLNAKGTVSSFNQIESVGVEDTASLNAGITASVTTSGKTGTITLTGAVSSQAQGTVELSLRPYGNWVPGQKDVKVRVVYTPGGSVTLSNDQTNPLYNDYGITVTSDRTGIILPNGTTYTFVGKISLLNLRLKIEGNTDTNMAGVKTTITSSCGLDYTNQVRRNELEKAMNSTRFSGRTTGVQGVSAANGGFSFQNSYAVRSNFNAKVAEISGKFDANYANWIKTAKEKQYQANPNITNKKTNPTQSELDQSLYETIHLVLYMDVQVTKYNPAGTPGGFVAKLTPSWRLEARSTVARGTDVNNWYNENPYVIESGSLGVLSQKDTYTVSSGNFVGGVDVKIPFEDTYGLLNNCHWAHQDGTYVSAVTVADGTTGTEPNGFGVAFDTATFKLSHPAVSGEGYGTITLNNVEPLVSIRRTTAGTTQATAAAPELPVQYDNLQKAVDDAVKKDLVHVKNGYPSSSITVTGEARDFQIYAEGNTQVSCSASGVLHSVQSQSTGTLYSVQLDKAVAVAKPVETGDVTITVGTAANGYASVSASKAKAGNSITVTVTPSTGYNAGGLTIRTDTGASLSYSTVGTNATTRVTTYTFVVPEGAKSITVTPAFVAINTGATVTVSSTSFGTATTSAGTNRVAPGSTVSVTTVPSTGYRTMGLYVTSNAGNATATRTGVNSFVFTVPAGSTNVVVTPRFDVNNGTVFEDVWSTDYFSSSVAWAVRQGVTDGTSTYTFSPNNTCTRAQMVTFLWRAAGRPTVSGVSNPFYDVQAGTYYYDAVMWAVSKGITEGTSAHYFSPSATVTRGQAVTFLWRYAGKPAASTSSGFYDVPANAYYAQAVSWASAKGVTNGTSTTQFSPNSSCLRAQIVTFLYRNATGVRA